MQEFIRYKNSKISFSVDGSGDAVVFLHGFLESSSMWSDIVVNFSEKKIITIDLLGHGNSDCIGYVHTMEAMADAVQYVLSYLKISKAIFVGHSMGGYVALALATQNPKLIQKLCLVNSTATEDSLERKKLRDRAIQMAKQNYVALVSMSITNLFVSHISKSITKEIENCKLEALKVSVQGYIAACEGMKLRSNKEAIIKAKDFEVLYLVGRLDPVLNSESVIEECKRNNAKSIVFSNGHMSHLENKQELIDSLHLFLN